MSYKLISLDNVPLDDSILNDPIKIPLKFLKGAIDMEFIKIDKNKYMIKNSNSVVVSEEEKLKLEKKELVLKDISSNECQGTTTKKISKINRKLKNANNIVEEAETSVE